MASLCCACATAKGSAQTVYDLKLTNALVGSPDTIAEKLRSLQAEIGLSGILAELNCGGLIPHDRVLTAMQLLCEAVKPCLAA